MPENSAPGTIEFRGGPDDGRILAAPSGDQEFVIRHTTAMVSRRIVDLLELVHIDHAE